ncbi:hypothetical protein BH24ACT22_BH24ACT22_21910 [soil metagenome]
MRRHEPLKEMVRIWGIASLSFFAYRSLQAGLRLKRSERRLRGLLDTAADGFFVYDDRGRIQDVNRGACESLGYTREELLKLNVAQIEQSPSLESFEGLKERTIPGVPITLEGVHRRKDGTTYPVEIRVGSVGSGIRRLTFAIVRDITGSKQPEAALRESERRSRQLFENSADALFIHDENGRILDCNTEAVQILGYTRDELLSMKVGDVTIGMLTEEERRDLDGNTLWERVIRGDPGRIVGFDQNELRRKDGTTFPVEVGVGAIDYGGGRRILASVRDITARRELENELRRQALHDPLTDLPNRALFTDRLKQALKQTARRGEHVAVFFMDLDDFKSVNDSLGHEAGDQLLIAVARRISASVRDVDTVARLAGDEFTVLLEDLEDVVWATPVAERILAAFEEPFQVKGRDIKVAVSIGIAWTSRFDVSPAELLDRADKAMYRAKKVGGARSEFYDLIS